MASKVNPRSSQSLSQCACYKCNKNVFQLEKIIVGDHSLHESCFVCESCNCRLSSSNYTEQEGSYYCTKHSHIITQEENPKTVADTNSSTDEKICPFCKKQVYTADGVILDNEELVHRSCFACSECNISLTLGNFHTIQQKLFCTRHYYAAASNSPDINSRKKVRDLYTGSLDADPLLSSLEDLEVHEQNQKKSSTLENNSLVPPLSLKMMHEHSSPSSDDQKKETTEENKETEEEKENNEFRDTTIATKNEISDEGAKDSISYSENALDTEEDEQEKIDVSGDEPSEASPGPGRLSRSRSRKKKELKAHALNRKDTPEEKDTKKKSKKKRKGERSETEDTEDGGNDSSKQKGRRREKSRKQRNSQRVDNEPEDTKEDKKKKSKRGLFSIKKKPTRSSSGRKGSEDGSHSPSLTAFVSSRFRKPRKDSLTEQNAPKPLSPKLSPAQHQTKYSKPIESDSDESEGEPHDILQELAPLGSPDKKNRLARLNRGDSKDSKRPSSGLGLETRNKPPAILPVSLTVPVPFTTLQSLSTCANTIDEDIPLESLNIPETKEGLVWSSYELTRKLPTIDVTLPDDITPKPADVNERIMQDGYFIPTIFTFGVVGVQRRVLDYLSILQTTYPFDIKVIAGADVSPKAIQVLQERHGESFKEVSITQLLSMDLDWIIIGSTHNNTCENILLSLNSGKNVFCEKPVCLSVVDCLKIRDAHAKSGKKFYGGFVWRLVPFYQEIYEILHSNILGDIISVEANHLMSPSETGPLMSTSSRLRKYCQTPLFDTFCFEIDIINWLLESVPSKVGSFSGLNIFTPQNKPTGDEIEPYLDWEYKPVEENISLDPFSSEKDIDDNHVIMMEYRNKARVTCHVNTNSAFPQRRILICGLKGTLEGDLYTGTIRYKKISEQYETNIIQVTPGVAHGGGDQQIMENLMNATKNEPTDSFEGEEIFPSVITVLGIDQSKKEGKIIDLEPQWKKLGI